MSGKLESYRLFFKEFRRHFHSTGAVLPSGKALAAALSRHVRDGCATGNSVTSGRRILEVGPGTGAVTASIVAALGPQDEFDMVELNDEFVRHLQGRFEAEPAFNAVRERSRVIHARLEDLPQDQPYDLIISCLPLNNFASADVESILKILERLLHAQGTLTFFEYIGVRPMRSLVCSASERRRLSGISKALGLLFEQHEIHRDRIWPNVPPAYVHHIRFDGKNRASRDEAPAGVSATSS
jgi:phosphatidylethanolamine/phosphatidyl-N-methylethanolamine N-methyltransferase